MSDDTGPRVLDAPSDLVLPEPGKRLVPKGGRVGITSWSGSWTQYDTADGRLAEFGAVLTRAGGPGTPWALVVDGVTTAFPSVGRGVPADVRDLLLGVRAGAALRPVRRVEAERGTRHVFGPDGSETGQIADIRERVAETGPAAVFVERRRIEVSGADTPFLAAAVRWARKAGATERSVSAEADTGPEPATVGSALRDFLTDQRMAILRGDLGLRRHEDLVHGTRVAVRRVRSALRVVTVGEPDRVAALDTELRWWSAVLGAVRDTEVLRGHLRSSVADLADPRHDLVSASAAIEAALDADEAAARSALAAGLTSRRYLGLLRSLDDWSTAPPLTAEADRPRAKLSRYVRAVNRDLDTKLAKAGASAERLHGARKAAKRARYVASFAGRDAGKHGVEISERAKRLQTDLGDHQDCIVAADFLRRVAVAGPADAAFGCGVLWAHEQDRAADVLRRAVDRSD